MVNLNEFQKRVMEEFDGSSANLLMIAPTGVGKTFAMELMAAKAPGKVMYVAPLKALVYEFVRDIKAKVDQNVSAIAALSEAYEDDFEEVKEKVIATTYEKADSLLRRNYPWQKHVRLIIVDEIHNVADEERGKAIENVVEYALENGVRVVAASATVSFVDLLQEWMNAKLVKWDKRPIPLYKLIQVGHTFYDEEGNAYTLNSDLIARLVNKGKVVMVFAPTRKRAETLYHIYKKRYGDVVTYLHAGLHPDERQRVINDVLHGKYKVVVTTTALGQGVNLPFHTVIFDDVHLPVIEEGRFTGWRPLTPEEFDQICGRAGRPGFDEEGMCVIQASNVREAEILKRRYFSGKYTPWKPVHNVYDFVLQYLTRALHATFDKIANAVRLTLSLRDMTDEKIKSGLEQMQEYELIGFDGTGYYITQYGKAVGYSYLDVESAAYYVRNLDDLSEYREIVYHSPKVVEASKGVDVRTVVEAWIAGVDEDKIVKEVEGLTYSDLNKLVATVAWQAHGFARILSALGMDDDAKRVRVFALRVRYGVPAEALELVKLPGIGRKRAIALADAGIRNLSELCLHKVRASEVIGSRMVEYLCR